MDGCEICGNKNTSPWGPGWEDGIPRVARGVKNRANRLRALGNAVVPDQAYPIFRAIAEAESLMGAA